MKLTKKNIKILIIFGDIRDENFIFQNTKKIDVIFHLAALISILFIFIISVFY